MMLKKFSVKGPIIVMATTALFIGVVVSTPPKPLIQTDKTNFPADNLDALPSWDIANLQKATILLLPKHELGTPIIRLLIWQTEQFKGENKAFRVDSALLWAKFTNLSGRKQWALMDLYLHPGSQTWLTDEGLDPMWHPIRFFDHAPNNKEVYEFLRYWHFTPADSKIVLGAVRERTWREVIGESATKFYTRRD